MNSHIHIPHKPFQTILTITSNPFLAFSTIDSTTMLVLLINVFAFKFINGFIYFGMHITITKRLCDDILHVDLLLLLVVMVI